MATKKKRVVKKARRRPGLYPDLGRGDPGSADVEFHPTILFSAKPQEKSEVERLADDLERVVIEMQLRGDQREQLLGFVERLRAVG
jgi:hypothetical protein